MYTERWGARYLIYNTSAQACLKEFGIDKTVDELVPEDYRAFIEATARRMLARLEEAHPTPRPMSRVS